MALTVPFPRFQFRRNSITRRRKFLRKSPHLGRRPNSTFDLGTSQGAGAAFGDQIRGAVYFACEVAFVYGQEGIIFESGGSSIGAMVLCVDDHMIIRAGRAGNGASTTAIAPVLRETDRASARFIVPFDHLERDERSTLVWQFIPSEQSATDQDVPLDKGVNADGNTLNPLIIAAWQNGRPLRSLDEADRQFQIANPTLSIGAFKRPALRPPFTASRDPITRWTGAASFVFGADATNLAELAVDGKPDIFNSYPEALFYSYNTNAAPNMPAIPPFLSVYYGIADVDDAGSYRNVNLPIGPIRRSSFDESFDQSFG